MKEVVDTDPRIRGVKRNEEDKKKVKKLVILDLRLKKIIISLIPLIMKKCFKLIIWIQLFGGNNANSFKVIIDYRFSKLLYYCPLTCLI